MKEQDKYTKKLRNQFIILLKELGYGGSDIATVFKMSPQQVSYMYEKRFENVYEVEENRLRLEEYVKNNYLKYYVSADSQGKIVPMIKEIKENYSSDEYLRWTLNASAKSLKAELARIRSKLECGNISSSDEIYNLTLIIALIQRKLDIITYMEKAQQEQRFEQEQITDGQLKEMNEVFEKKESILRKNVEKLEGKNEELLEMYSERKRKLEKDISELEKEYKHLKKKVKDIDSK